MSRKDRDMLFIFGVAAVAMLALWLSDGILLVKLLYMAGIAMGLWFGLQFYNNLHGSGEPTFTYRQFQQEQRKKDRRRRPRGKKRS